MIVKKIRRFRIRAKHVMNSLIDKNYMILKQDAIRRAIKPKNTTISIKAPVNAYKPISNHASNVSINYH